MLGALSNDQVFTPSTSPSWEDIGKRLALNAGQDLLGAVAGKVSAAFGGARPMDPAALEAARQAREKADQQKMLMLAAGVLGAVVLGALVLRR